MVVAGLWSVLCKYPHLQKAEDLVKKATEADNNEKPDMTTMEVSELGSSRVVVSGYMHSYNCSTVVLICLLIRRFESTSPPS